MIVIKFPNIVKPTPVVSYVAPTPSPMSYGISNQSIINEVQRRDKIIKELVKEFPYKVGDYIIPQKEEDQKKWGKCTVLAICSEYIHLSKDDKWPKNDNPLIVTVSAETGEIFFATTNYFKK